MNKTGSLFLIMVSIILLSSCSPSSAYSGQNKIMLILNSENTNYNQSIIEGAHSAAAEYSDVILLKRIPSKEDNYQQQNKYIHEAIKSDVEAIIFSAANIRESSELIKEASEKGIKVIMIESYVMEEQQKFPYIGTNNEEAGIIAAQTIIDLLGNEAKIGLINYIETNGNGIEKERSTRKYLRENSNVEIIANNKSWYDEATAQLLAEEMILVNSDLEAIISFNEITTIGSARAIEESGLSEQIAVIGFDRNIEMIPMLEKGIIDALVVQNPFAIGYLSVQKSMEEDFGKEHKQSLFTGVELITPENMFYKEKQKLLFPFSY